MSQWIFLGVLFIAKVFDNALGTAKTILVQRNRSFLAGITMVLSNYIYLTIMKNIVSSEGQLSTIIVSLGAGVGCYFAVAASNHLSKERLFVNVILSDNVEAIRDLRDFLAEYKITNVVSDSYAKDWSKTLSITAYAETKDDSKLIDQYLANSENKFKRVVKK